MKTEYPVLSLNERDRRWLKVREMMRQKGVECLLLGGFKSREQLEGYLTNDYPEGVVIFPLEGDPVCLSWTGTRITRQMESTLRGFPAWVEDMRVGVTGPAIAAVLKEKGFERGKIGVVGLESRAPGESGGTIPYKTWDYILEELKGATFIDLSLSFCELILVKSDEELELVRWAARAGERACEVMINNMKPGVSERSLYAEIMKSICESGAAVRYPLLILHTGIDNMSWGPPMWQYQAQPPRILQAGDLVQAEIFPCYGGLEAQQQMAVSLNPVNSITAECGRVARISYEVGLEALRPGKTFQQVCDAMEEPIRSEGCWHLTPLIHSLNPIGWTSATQVGIEQMPGHEKYNGLRGRPAMGGDLVIQAGMVFELEPNACKGKQRTNIGGTVIVRQDGVEELNILPTEMRVAE